MKKYKIDISFILVFICFIFSSYQKLYLMFILLIFLHELGHLFIAFIFKIKVLKLKLYALGFLMKVEDVNSFYKEFLLDFGGIFVNILLIPFLNGEIRTINFLILFFNLLPIIPLDGARITKSLLCYMFPYLRALKLQVFVSFIVLSVVSVLCFFFLDYLVLFNIVYLWIILISNYENIKLEYESFLLRRYLDTLDLKIKYVSFSHDLVNKLYLYFNIYTSIRNKRISEKEILDYHYKNNTKI